MLILTSNVGSQAILESLGDAEPAARPGEGGMEVTVRTPTRPAAEPAENGAASETARIEQVVKDEMSSRFRPEFLNRLDQIIVFHPLSRSDVAAISGLMLSEVFERSAEQGVQLELSDALTEQLIDEGYDAQYGARPLRRAVQRLVEDVAAECLLDGFAAGGGALAFDVGDNGGGSCVRCSNARGEVRTLDVAAAQGIERGSAAQRADASAAARANEASAQSADPTTMPEATETAPASAR